MTEAKPSDARGSLFLQPAYLNALSQSGCVDASCGWQALASAGPALYLKAHSWGEFVFDFEIAQAYQRVGLNYYPKLVCAVPFTPVPGPRLCGRSAAHLQTLAVEQGASSAHVLFTLEQERDQLLADGWLRRQDLRYVWHNQAYADFEDFLAALQSKKRKKLRAERRAVNQLGLQIEWCDAAQLSSEDWAKVYALYARTYAVRGQSPYLNQACLQAWGQAMPQAMKFCLARDQQQIVAMAFYFQGVDTLYGRHWGCAFEADKLHFELCYYQAIEHCIREGLQLFDAGVQGGHRLLRGFEPILTDSVHWYAENRFHQALDAAFAHEREQMQRHFIDARRHTSYRRSE